MQTQTLPRFLVLLAGGGTVFLLTRLTLPLLMRAAARVGAVDIPTDTRRMHTHPVPRTGGMAIFLSFYTALPLASLPESVLYPLLAGAAVVFVGIWDDVYRLPPLPKLAIEFAASAGAVGLLLYLEGKIPVLEGLPPLLAAAVGFLLPVVLANAHNMLDGIDGLCGSVSLTEGTGLTLLLFLQGKTGAATAAGMLTAALPAFLHFNRHPARVFLGDTGSATLGFLLGILALFTDCGTGLGWLTLPLLFALPLSDLLFAVLRRLAAGRNPFSADRGHWHHRLADRGLGQRETCRWLTLLAGSGVALALTLTRAAWLPYGAFLALWGAGLIGALWLVTERRAVSDGKDGI